MTEQYIGWALVVGILLGGALVWFVAGRLPRRTEDVGREERRAEAEWIARAVESRGGVAPVALVDEILELHADYLAGPPMDLRPEPLRRRPRPDFSAAQAAPPPPETPAVRSPAAPRSELADEDRRPV